MSSENSFHSSNGTGLSSNDAIPRAVVAKSLEVTERTLITWEAELGLAAARAPGPRAAYRVGPLLKWLFDQGGSEGSPLQKARIRDFEARAGLRELELKRESGELVPLELVAGMVRDTIEQMAASLLTARRLLGFRWSKRLGVSPGEAMALIDEITNDLRAILRKSLARVADKVR